MVKLNKIYTRTGDDGTTGLVDGSRVVKFDLHMQACGDIDEANAMIGMVRQHTAHAKTMDDMLERIQHDLFDLGADIATPVVSGQEEKALRIIESQVQRLEHEMDAMNEHIAPLNSFVLPGGSAASAALHVARCIVRRAERKACSLASETRVNPYALQYLNRLSDHLFVMSRACNKNGTEDVLWRVGCNR